MTTIAWDGTTVAYDSLMVSGTSVASETAEKATRDGRLLAVGAGDAAVVRAFCRWLVLDEDEPDIEDVNFCVFFFDGASAWQYNSSKHPLPLCVPDAAGTGMETALAAMHMGKTAREALRLASKLDTCTGGRIRTFRPTITAEAV